MTVETTVLGSVVSIQVGRPRVYAHAEGEWTSSIVKDPVTGPVDVRPHNLVGDEQADLTVHGGPDKAVYCYSYDHYPWWAERLGADLPYGGLGENLTVQGATEERVCIGDSLSIGSAVFEVSQPRQPCYKLERRWDQPGIGRLMVESGLSGYYLRVRQSGVVAAGDAVLLVDRPHPDVTVAQVSRALYAPGTQDEDARLAALPALGAALRAVFGHRAARHQSGIGG